MLTRLLSWLGFRYSPPMSDYAVTVYRDAAGEWRWRATASNGEVVATSGEGYVDKHHATEMASRVNGVAEEDITFSID